MTTTLTRRAGIALALGGLGGVATLAGVAGLATRAVKKPAQMIAAAGVKARPLAPPTMNWPTLDALAQNLIDEKLTPGLSITVMMGGVLLYSKGFGIADLATGAAVTPQTGFRIASITKQFTAAAVMKLAEMGKLSIDDPLSKHMPEVPGGERVTLRQMLSHTSGMGDYINGQDKTILEAAQHTDYSSEDLYDVIVSRKPLFRIPPGVRWMYSNSAFSLMGIMVERVSGLAFADALRQWIFVPAGLASTQVDPTCTAAVPCSGYRPDYRAPGGFDLNLPISPSFAGGAGGMRSSTEDLCRWHDALWNGRILTMDSVKTMLTPVRLNNGQPAFENRSEALQYGLGMGLGVSNGWAVTSHGGRINGFTGTLRSIPDARLTMAALYNSDGSGMGRFSAGQKAIKNEALRLGLETLGFA